MKKAVLLLAVIALAACARQQDADSIRNEINDYKKQITDINSKIEGLEKDLKTLDGGEADAFTVPVIVENLSLDTFRHFIEVSGSAEAVKEAYISAETSGQISRIYVKEGDYVRKGQLLAELNTDVLNNSIAEVQGNLELAKTVFEKQSRLWKQKIGSEIQFLNAKNAMVSLQNKLETLNSQKDMAIIRAPENGIIDNIYKKKGELAQPGVQLMQLVNLDEIYINADVSESYLASLKEGDEVTVMVPAYPGMELKAPIYRKGNVINPNNRTFRVQLKLKNTDNKLKPNILAVIRINDFTSDSALIVPSIIVKQDITGYYVYVSEKVDKKTIARKVYVEPGKSSGDMTMIESGLKAGDKVIITGYNQVADGTDIRIETKDVS